MTFLKFISIIFLLIVGINFNSALAAKFKIDPSRENKYLADYMNSFHSINEIVEDFKFLGIITSEDQVAILETLKKIGVDKNTKNSLAKADGHKIQFGRSAGLINENDTVKTFSGKVINIKKTMTVSDIFNFVLNLQMDKKTAGLSRLFINEAFAVNPVDSVDAVNGALGFIVKHVGLILYGDLSMPLSGLSAAALATYSRTSYVETVAWVFRKFLTGDVKCDKNGGYQFLGFKDRPLLSQVWKDSQIPPELCTKVGTSYRMVQGHFETLCRLSYIGEKFFSDSFNDRGKMYYFKDEILSRHLGHPVPACNEENAKTLKAKVKAKFETELKKRESGERLTAPSDAATH